MNIYIQLENLKLIKHFSSSEVIKPLAPEPPPR